MEVIIKEVNMSRKKRQRMTKIVAGVLAGVMLFGIIAAAIVSVL